MEQQPTDGTDARGEAHRSFHTRFQFVDVTADLQFGYKHDVFIDDVRARIDPRQLAVPRLPLMRIEAQGRVVADMDLGVIVGRLMRFDSHSIEWCDFE